MKQERELPTTESLTGSDPDFTGGLSTEGHMRRIRGGEDYWNDYQALRAEVAALRRALEALPSILHGMPGTVATPDCPFKVCRCIHAALATRSGEAESSA